MKLAAFDIEVATPIADDGEWPKSNLGIACAAIALSDKGVEFWQGVPRLKDPAGLVERLIRLVRQDYTLLTWNGCGFDFRVLAEESGMWQECGRLALNHVDLMLLVTFTKGWRLSLQAALLGAGLKGKQKKVHLSTGEEIHDMDGAKAPILWTAGEYAAVLSYLHDDVSQLLELAQIVQERRCISWISRSGNLQEVTVKRLLTVAECFNIPEPDTSWMSNPPRREQFTEWIEF